MAALSSVVLPLPAAPSTTRVSPACSSNETRIERDDFVEAQAYFLEP